MCVLTLKTTQSMGYDACFKGIVASPCVLYMRTSDIRHKSVLSGVWVEEYCEFRDCEFRNNGRHD